MPLRKLYSKWMFRWETKLTTRDTNRVERPFEWGLDWMRGWPFVNGHQPQAADTESYVHQLNDKIVGESDTFFYYKVPTDFRLENRKVERFHTGSAPAPKDKKVTHADFLRRSEERRVGKECRSRMWREKYKKKRCETRE